MVFRNMDSLGRWPLRKLRDGFRHVEIWVEDRSVWARLDPCYEFAVLQVHLEPPQSFIDPALKPTFVPLHRDIPLGGLPLAWNFGPVTCVTAVKLALGLRLPFVLTPYQLYRHLEDHNG